MRKHKLRKLAAVILTALLIFSLTAAAFAAENIIDEIQTMTLEAGEDTVQVRLTTGTACTVWVALYNENGKMLGIGTQAVEAGERTVNIQLSAAAPEQFTAKAFLLDETYTPLCGSFLLGQAETPPVPPSDEVKVLVAYFSATNNTKRLAEYIADGLNADLYGIAPEIPYTSADLNYNTDCRANREQNDASARPAISGSVDNMEQYDVIFLGYPIWWGQAPKIISTFLEGYDFSGKTIVPFCTSGSSGIGSSATNLHALAGAATWMDGWTTVQRRCISIRRGELGEWSWPDINACVLIKHGKSPIPAGVGLFRPEQELENTMKRIFSLFSVILLALALAGCGNTEQREMPISSESSQPPNPPITAPADSASPEIAVPEEFILIRGGTFQMGSPKSEAWRSEDETAHTVNISDYFISRFEITQAEYQAVTGENPSAFAGADLPVESISWMDAIQYCNARSTQEGLTPAYTVDGQRVSWDRSANGYRLPTEAEWEYACRAGTETPFNTETSISADEANYWGHYPYLIEDNYFSQGNLETKPGVYRQTTVAVGSFEPNAWGLYDMHGNVSEWVWDWYGSYETGAQIDPTGPDSGTRRVYRGGGWNDFAKNLRSAYRATLPPDSSSFNLGLRLVRNAGNGSGSVESSSAQTDGQTGGNVLIAYFSWGGNTRGIAAEIQRQTGAELFEIQMVTPYSTDYNTVLDQAQEAQNAQDRPELSTHVEDMSQYDTIILGYPNWWASIPMPIASFLEEYDFSGKTIIPFCSHGGGRFGQSLTAITKLVPDAVLGEGLAVSYSGGSGLSGDVTAWLEENNIPTN